jgi:thioredoxin reductase
MHNFVTRDGTTPDEFRSVARQQLRQYSNVEARDVAVSSVGGTRGAFRIELAAEVVAARRILLCTGMVDEIAPLEGFAALWGHAIFQCPYCHGWEVRDRRWGYLALADTPHLLPFVLQLRSWSDAVTVFTGGAFQLSGETHVRFGALGIKVETASVARLVARGDRLEAVELEGGRRAPLDALFAHPPQRQVELVRALRLELDEEGYVRLDPMRRETSVPGVYAAGDLTTRQQAAIIAAASGMQAAAAINVDLMMELAASGA